MDTNTGKPNQKMIRTEKSTSTNRKLSRQESITRGTASSRAKAVKQAVVTIENNNIKQRRLAVKVRNQSLTHMETNRLLLASTSTSLIAQRRGSWSTLERMPSSPLLEITSPLKKSIPDRSIVNGSTISSSNSSSSSVSTRVHSSCSKKDGMITKPGLFKYDKEDNDASSHAEESQQKQLNPIDPLETCLIEPEKEEVVVVSEIHHSGEEEETEEVERVNCMRRPICEICTCNVKVNASISSKASNQKKMIQDINTSPSSSEDMMMIARTRSNSPTSPIPTRRPTRPNEFILNDNSDKWNALLIQQQKILEFVNKEPNNMMTLSSIEFNKDDETFILETQIELLKRFESCLLLSSLTPSLVTIASPNTEMTTITLVEQENTTHDLPILNWQTQIEYSITKFKWNLSRWFGTVVGDGRIEEQEFDTLGYTKTISISGICVTTEPGLLPKKLQKYYPNRGQFVCHKYIIHLCRENRLTLFSLLNHDDWAKDSSEKTCQFHLNEIICDIEFNVFHRRHHCRSCGHLFCQTHCSNRLPLFIPNGKERGEWSRVCDTCFYARIDPQFIARC